MLRRLCAGLSFFLRSWPRQRQLACTTRFASKATSRTTTLFGLARRVDIGVDDVAAPILGPSRFVMFELLGFLSPEADRLDVVCGNPKQCHSSFHRVGPALPQGQVVFAATALVAVTLDTHLEVLVLE